MNKILLLSALALVFASALIIIGNVAMQSAQACPNKGSGGVASNVNPSVPNSEPTSELATGQKV
jgi:hypothetical protein